MTDKKPPKNTEFLDPNLITCSQCGAVLGGLIDIDAEQGEYQDRYQEQYQEQLLQIGALIIKEMHGNCIQCGRPFYYSISEKRLDALIRRSLVNRNQNM